MKKLVITLLVILLTGSLNSCASRTANGSIIGGLLGAGGGLLIGKKKNRGRNALIGGAGGALLGGIIGHATDKPKPQVTETEVQQNKGEYIEVERKKTIIVTEKVAVQKETKKFYIDPKSGRKIYIKK